MMVAAESSNGRDNGDTRPRNGPKGLNGPKLGILGMLGILGILGNLRLIIPIFPKPTPTQFSIKRQQIQRSAKMPPMGST